MNLKNVSRVIAVVSLLTIGPATGIAYAQSAPTATTTCAAATGTLSQQQQSLVNDYEILVARANSKHTAVPPMPDEVAVLIGCLSPASQTGGTAPTTSTVAAAPPTAPAVVQSTGMCPPDGLTKDQLSMINDYEILVAKANSKHTAVPPEPPDITSLIACT
jgi:hypothetical protein